MGELTQQLEVANRLKDDYNRQLKKYQQMIKELQHDSEESRQAKEELAASLREIERKYALWDFRWLRFTVVSKKKNILFWWFSSTHGMLSSYWE